MPVSPLPSGENGYRTLVANIPGLVFQCRRSDGRGLTFTWLSEQCTSLLGLSAETLINDSAELLNRLLPEDRQGFLQSIDRSMETMSLLNWQGGLWIDNWQDIKWINIRATPRLEAGSAAVCWDGIITNITHTWNEEQEIRRSHAQMAALSAHIQQLKEQERARIARELHDDLGGNLTAIKMAVVLLHKRCPNDPLTQEKVSYINQLVDRTLESIHRIAGDLRPSVLDFGIVPAIEWQAREFMRLTGIPLELHTEDEEIALSADQATALFRIFQEALTNISKHANPTQVKVELHESARISEMIIADDGKGMEQSDQLKPNSFGLRGMAERVESLHGTLHIDSAPGQGTRLTIRIPLDDPHEPD